MLTMTGRNRGMRPGPVLPIASGVPPTIGAMLLGRGARGSKGGGAGGMGDDEDPRHRGRQ
jgi:hypothetical protein